MPRYMLEADPLIEKAFTAYYRRLPAGDEPSRTLSVVREHKGKTYVILNNRYGELAVFCLGSRRLIWMDSSSASLEN